MNRTSRAVSITAAGTALLLVAGCSGAGDGENAGAETRVLRLASPISEQSVQGQGLITWAEDVAEATGGTLEIEIHPTGSLLAGTDILPGVADGRADLGLSYSNYHAADLPYWNVVAYPFVTPSWDVFAQAFAQLEEEFPEIEQAWADYGIVPLADLTNGAAASSSRTPVDSIEDLQGKRYRAPGSMADIAENAGVDPVFMELAEMYEALQRGVLDGWIGTELSASVGLNVQEVTPYYIDFGIGQYSGARIFANAAVWDGLSDEQREALEGLSAEYPSRLIDLVTDMETAACRTIGEAGGEVKEADQDDPSYQAWRAEATSVISDALLGNATAAGIEAEDYQRIIERYVELAEEIEASGGSAYVDGLASCVAE